MSISSSWHIGQADRVPLLTAGQLSSLRCRVTFTSRVYNVGNRAQHRMYRFWA